MIKRKIEKKLFFNFFTNKGLNTACNTNLIYTCIRLYNFINTSNNVSNSEGIQNQLKLLALKI